MPGAVHDTRKDAHTALRALDVAERLAQTNGFNGFSYADIAAELGITKATLHYHFASKADLGLALITRYSRTLCDALAGITGPAPQRLRHYVRVYEDLLIRNRMCLCGMLAAEYATLPPPMQRELARFFALNDAWLEATLEQGRADGTVEFDGSALEVARMLTAALEGALLLARSCQEPERLAAVAHRLLSQICVVGPMHRALRAPKAGGKARSPPPEQSGTRAGKARLRARGRKVR